MEQLNRIYELDNLLKNSQYPVALSYIMDELECSKSTAKRIIRRMRDYLDAPIEYHREYRGYYYNHADSEAFTAAQAA